MTYVKICDEKDAKFNALIANLVETNVSNIPYNPKMVVEIRNGKFHRLLEHWDKEKGLLPERQVMYNYNITEESKFLYSASSNEILNTKKKFNFSSGASIYDDDVYEYDKCFGPNDEFKSVKYSFEVDNYLNLYDRKKNIYFLINTAPFSKTLFHFLKDTYLYFEKDTDSLEYYLDQIQYALRLSGPLPRHVSQLVDDALCEVLPNNLNSVYEAFNKHRNEEPVVEENIIIDSSDELYDDPTFCSKLDVYLDGNSKPSLKLIDWFCTRYAKKNNTNLIICQNDRMRPFNVHEEYCNQLKLHGKRNFDTFARGEKIKQILFNDVISSTHGQLNFFEWFIGNQLDLYVEKHENEISDDMYNTGLRNLNEQPLETKTEIFEDPESRAPLENITNLIVHVDKDGNRTFTNNEDDFENMSEDPDQDQDVYVNSFESSDDLFEFS